MQRDSVNDHYLLVVCAWVVYGLLTIITWGAVEEEGDADALWAMAGVLWPVTWTIYALSKFYKLGREIRKHLP